MGFVRSALPLLGQASLNPQLPGTPAGRTAALVLQITALGPDWLNLNLRVEGL